MSKPALLAAGAALAAAAWWYYKRKTAPKPPPKPQPKKRRLCACGCGRVASMRCGRCKTARYATRECQASHARAHAPVCYFDCGVQAMDAGEPRKAAKLFETSVEKAERLPQDERVKRRSAAYLALGRARQMVKEFDAALAAYAAGVKSARAANVPADAVECMVGAANVVRAIDGAAAAIELFAAAAARADEAIASGGARRGPGALPGAEATRLVAARASAWANQATSMLATRGADALRAKALLKRALDAREAMARYYPESSEAKRQLATSRANYGLVLRLVGDPGAEAMIEAAKKDAAAIGEAGAGIMQALQRNSSNLGKSAPPPGTCPICLESYSDASVESGCGHRFCRECLRTWLKRSNRCPTCRQCLNFAAAPEYLDFSAGDET
jgi:hypothetical protein